MSNYYGECMCQGKYLSKSKEGQSCNNKAYFINPDGGIYCGLHSDKKNKKKLAKNPNAAADIKKLYEDRELIVEQMALQNRQMNKKGEIICSKLRMLKQPDHFDGYRKIFPNFKHADRKDGFGCPTLSPKSLGPICHNMQNLPIAKNLENYHQAAKIFSCEVEDNNITKKSIDLRIKMYNSPTPYRHKFQHNELKKICNNKNINIPLFSVYYDVKGNEHRYSYIECRYFYCHYYEILAPITDEFKKLKQMLDDGYNLQIIGYDGYPIDKTLMEHYLDEKKPFGHELVLTTLLILDNPKKYPWNIFYESHKNIYEGVI